MNIIISLSLVGVTSFPQNMFWAKLQCQIVDLYNNFPLLHFQFDRWLYKTVRYAQVSPFFEY